MTYLAHTILNVSDFDISKSFYDTLMSALGISGREVHNDEMTKIHAYEIPEAPLYIQWLRDEERKPFVRNVGLDHICLGVEEREMVDRVHEIIRQTGVKITREPREYPEYTEDYYAFYFRDPDGIPLEVAYM